METKYTLIIIEQKSHQVCGVIGPFTDYGEMTKWSDKYAKKWAESFGNSSKTLSIVRTSLTQPAEIEKALNIEYKRTTYGRVIQKFDSNGNCVHQEFIPADKDTEYYLPGGTPINISEENRRKQQNQPFDMIQPKHPRH